MRRTLNGSPLAAALCAKPPDFARAKRARGAKRAGLRYQERVNARFENEYAHEFLPGPWIRFRDESGWHVCQPDGLIIQPRRLKITVLEFKLKHTRDAWRQLFLLYLPVVAHAFSVAGPVQARSASTSLAVGAAWRFAACEVVRWFDPAEQTPAPVALCARPEDASPGAFGVHICRA